MEPVHAESGCIDHRLRPVTVESIRMKTIHVLLFIDLHSRRVIIGGVTDEAANLRWCTQIARNLVHTEIETAGQP